MQTFLLFSQLFNTFLTTLLFDCLLRTGIHNPRVSVRKQIGIAIAGGFVFLLQAIVFIVLMRHK